ncbi:uncharacterized protein LOC125662470 isoform X2 [Ostrea edulis]|uniref:uncharacterized protein LOC125662470 isoform X2 n=1 Tax=Ostrea edulis TaxID=37623 RepID=UPI0024AF7EC9|nr:uncharacterized protein LOC125662470 isoform X2 [Ostrea edulis]
MASGPDPAARSRFAKLGMAINEVLTQTYRDILKMEVSPNDVYNRVRASPIYLKLRTDQELLLKDANSSGYDDFDITLMYTLLRNICSKIPHPTKGWGGSSLPAAGDNTVGDDIERIRLIRNHVYGHSNSASISQAEFDKNWSKIDDVCRRLRSYSGKNYMGSLKNITSQCLEKEHEGAVIAKMKDEWKRYQSILEMITSIQTKVEQLTGALVPGEKRKVSGNRLKRLRIHQKAKESSKQKDVDTCTEMIKETLNAMVEVINERSTEEDIYDVQNKLEQYIQGVSCEEDKESAFHLLENMKKKIFWFAKIHPDKQITVLKRFVDFLFELRTKYDVDSVLCKTGSVLLELTFGTESGYTRFLDDVKKGIFGQRLNGIFVDGDLLSIVGLMKEEIYISITDIMNEETTDILIAPENTKAETTDIPIAPENTKAETTDIPIAPENTETPVLGVTTPPPHSTIGSPVTVAVRSLSSFIKYHETLDKPLGTYQQGRNPTFSKMHGKNIDKDKNHPRGINTLKWKFSESQGIAFSDFPLKENRKYEAIFNGSGHASIGLTQTDPENLKTFPQAIEKDQILFLTDIRFHKRTCIVDIVKRDDSTGFVFETHYQKGTTQKKTLVHTADVWIVIYLKFGDISAELKDKENQAALRFHKKHDKNITLTRERYKISLTVPYPLAYAFIGDAIAKGQSIHVQARHVDDNKKPRQYHLRIGISNTTAISSDDLQFSLNVVHKLERDNCIGDIYICVTKRGRFHIWKDVCLFVRDLSRSNVNPRKPLYVCFEIVRICLETFGISVCTHKTEGIENPGPSVENKPYVSFYHVDSLRHLDQKLSDGKFTAEDVRTINNITEDLTEYANFVVSDVDHEREATEDDYLIPVSATLGTNDSWRQEKTDQDPQESDNTPMLTIIYEMLVKMARTAEKQHLERRTLMTDLQVVLQKNIESIEMIQNYFKSPSHEKPRRYAMDSFCRHLRTICADFIQSVFVFPLCDHLFQYEILHLEQYTVIREEYKRQPIEANRTLFRFLSIENYTPEQLENIKQAFIRSNQEHFLPQ